MSASELARTTVLVCGPHQACRNKWKNAFDQVHVLSACITMYFQAVSKPGDLGARSLPVIFPLHSFTWIYADERCLARSENL